MRFFLIFTIILWTSVDSTVSSQTLSTISGPFQSNPAVSALTSDDCLSTVDWHEIILITAVPIAAGFGLLLLAAFLKDLRQACKSNRSCPPAHQTIRAKNERTYVIDVEYGGRTKWGLFLRWCAVQTSAEIKNRRLVRLRGSTGFSNWVSFDLVLGKKSEQKTMTTPRAIGKLVAVESKYPRISDRLHPRALPTSNTRACLRGLFKRACDIEIRRIHAKDTKTQDHYFTVSGPSSGGISSTDQGIITTLPLLYSTTPPKTKISYVAYYFTNASLWTSTFMPQYQGNFTGVRHITLLFTCISYTMVAADALSKFAVMEKSVVLSWPNYSLTLSVVIRAAVVGVVVFAFIGIVEMIFRAAPSVWSLHPPCVPVQQQHEDMFPNSVQPTCVQSVAGDFYGGNSISVGGIPCKSSSAPDIMQTQSSKQVRGNTQMHFNQPALYGKGDLKPCDILSNTSAKMNNAVDVKTMNAESPTTKTRAAGLTRCSQWNVVNGREIYKLHAEKLNSKQFTKSTFDTKPDASLSPDVTINPRDNTNNSKNDIKLAVSSNCNVVSSGNSSQTSDVTWIPCSSTSIDFKSSSFITDTVTSYQPRSTSSASAARSSSSLFSNESIEKGRPDDDHDDKTFPAIDCLTQSETKQTSLIKTIFHEPLQSRPDSISCTVPATIQPYYNKQNITIEKQAAGDRHCTAHSEQYKFQDRDPSEEFVSYFAVLTEENIKTAQVKRTKNYINKFTDMGKAKIVILPYDDSEAPQNVSDIDEMSIISILDDIPPVKTNPDEKSPAACAAVTTRSDYIINIPMDFKLPSVTIQTSTSLRSVFFGIRKWFAGLLSKPRLDIGDDYKLEVTENDSSMKTPDENTSVLSVTQGAAANHHIQPGPSEAKTKHTAAIWGTISGNNNCDTEENTTKSHHNLQGSVFQTASGMIEYNPVSSSTSWNSIQSVQNALTKQLTPYDDPTAINQNNSKDTTVTQVGRPKSPIKPDSVPSKNYLFLDSAKTSEESSVEPKSSTSEGIHCSQSITSDDSACNVKYIRSGKNQDQNGSLSVKGVVLTEDTSSSSYPQSSSISDTHSSSIFSSSSVTDIEKPRNSYFQALYEADQTPSIVSIETNTVPVAMFILLICHVLLIASCVLAMWWSIYSLHGFCWSACWEWAATAVTAVLIQAIVYDTIKAAIITFLKRLSFKEETKPKPYSIIL